MNYSVLIVDDNPANMKLVSFLLAKKGYEVSCASSAAAAIERLETSIPSAILLDLQMPSIDGFSLARRLKADPRTRDIALLAVTAYAMIGDERRAREAGCDGYVTKPIDTRALPGIVAALIEDRARR